MSQNLVVSFLLKLVNETVAPMKKVVDDLAQLGREAAQTAKPVDEVGEMLDDLTGPAKAAAKEAQKAAHDVGELGKTAAGSTGGLDAATAALYEVAKPAQDAAKGGKAAAEAFDDIIKPAREAARETEDAARALEKAAGPSADLADKVDDAGEAMDDATRKGHGFKLFLGIDLVNAAHLAGQAIAGTISFVADLGRKMVNWVSDEAELAQRIAESAQAADMSATAYQRLKYAFERSRMSGDDLDGTLKSLKVKMTEADAGNKKLAETFLAAGVRIRDTKGHLKSVDEVLAELADKFATLPPQFNRVAVATYLFGDAGSRLVPLLNRGSAGIKALGDEAERTNNILGEDAIKASQDLNDAWDDLNNTTNGLKNELWTELAPVLTSLIRHVDELITQNKEDILKGMKDGLAWLDLHLDDIILLINEFASALKSAAELAAAVGSAIGFIKDGWDSLPKGLRDFISGNIAPAFDPLSGWKAYDRLNSPEPSSNLSLSDLQGIQSTLNIPSATGQSQALNVPAMQGQSAAQNTLLVKLDRGLLAKSMQSSPSLPTTVEHDLGSLVTP